jgi:N-acetylglutamate synthase-like GNAT family acetyltransferase
MDAPGNPRLWHIRPWRREDQNGVVALISGIQRGEFGLSITPADQPDLVDIPGFYRPGAGEFWVAEATPTDPERPGEVVGCIALLDIGQGQAALRKMFVHQAWRGPAHGIAAALLHTLLEHARTCGVRQIFLGTTTRFLAAHRFYEKHGFARMEKTALPGSFPVMAVDSVFYSLVL